MSTEPLPDTITLPVSMARFRGWLFRSQRPDFGEFLFPGQGFSWGELLTPAELRMIYMVGNSRLVTIDGSYITDDMIQGIIDRTAYSVAEKLGYEIYPRRYIARPRNPDIPRHREDYTLEKWDDLYDYKNDSSHDNFYVRLRHRPVVRLERWEFGSPFNDIMMIDIKPGAEIKYETGILRNYMIPMPMYAKAGGVATYRALQAGGIGKQVLRNTYLIDYIAGHEHANDVPHEIREIVGWIVTKFILSAYGDGIVSGMANFSISVGTASESVGTTMSATSAYFGARIVEIDNILKEWWKTHARKYMIPTIGFL